MAIYFATNRSPIPKTSARPRRYGDVTNAISPHFLRFGCALPENRGFSIDTGEEFLVTNSAKTKIQDESIFGSKRMFKNINQNENELQDIVIFIHGFDYSFTDSIKTAHTLQLKLQSVCDNKGVIMGTFSWPSNRGLLGQVSDQAEAQSSGVALARTLYKVGKFIDDPVKYNGDTLLQDINQHKTENNCNRRIHIVAHNIGVYVLRHAIQVINKNFSGEVYKLFDQVCLFAADEDSDALELDYKLGLLPKYCRNINVYFNYNDPVLSDRKYQNSNSQILGCDGVINPYNVSSKVNLIDCTGALLKKEQHDYFLKSNKVVEDFIQVLSQKKPHQIKGRHYINEKHFYEII